MQPLSRGGKQKNVELAPLVCKKLAPVNKGLKGLKAYLQVLLHASFLFTLRIQRLGFKPLVIAHAKKLATWIKGLYLPSNNASRECKTSSFFNPDFTMGISMGISPNYEEKNTELTISFQKYGKITDI